MWGRGGGGSANYSLLRIGILGTWGVGVTVTIVQVLEVYEY